jgi:uncharacterized membrane protein
MMKTWWKDKGWPWIKENWWALLLLPVMLLVGLGMGALWLMRRPPQAVVVDPVEAADARALAESTRREKELAEERDRLAEQLKGIQEEYAKLRSEFESRLADEVEALRQDPERLREAMLRTGRES